jgi:hypothetical protein
MSAFVVYKPSGQIVRVGTCPASMVCLQADHESGEAVIEASASLTDSVAFAENGDPYVVPALTE